jgi:hypothetical protein
MTSLARRVLPLACLLILPVLAGAGEPAHLAATQLPSGPVLCLSVSGDALLHQRLEVDLAAGPNTLAYPFGRLDVALDALDVQPVSPETGLTLSEVSLTPDARDTAVWQLTADKACRATLQLRHPLKGLEWRLEYAVTLSRDARTCSVAANLVVTNRSKLVFDNVLLRLPGGQQLQTALAQNETFQKRLFMAEEVACEPMTVYDPARYGSAVAAVLRLPRTGNDPFGAGLLTAGKVRFYSGDETHAYLGEDNLPLVAPHERVDLKVGTVPEITATRKVAKTSQLDVKTDIRDKLALYNQEDDIEVELRNQRKTPVSLILRDKFDGDWSLLRPSVPGTRLDADVAEFTVSLEPSEVRKVTYTVRRANQQP